MELLSQPDPSVIKNTRALLISSPKGISLTKFNKDYRKMIGKPFPYRNYGCNSALELLRAIEMKGAVKMVRSVRKEDGGWMLFGVPDTNHFVPSWVQKAYDSQEVESEKLKEKPEISESTEKRSKHNKLKDSVLDKIGEPVKLSRDCKGTVSVYVHWQSLRKKKKAKLSDQEIDDMVQCLSQLMSQASKPLDIAVMSQGYAFVRFSSYEEAEAAMQLFNNKIFNGVRYTLRPAVPLRNTQAATKQKTNNGGTSQSVPWNKFLDNSKKSSPNFLEEAIKKSEDWSGNFKLSNEFTLSEDGLSDCDSEWDDSLLPDRSVSDCSDSHEYDWQWVVTRCDGGVSWRERLEGLCGKGKTITVKITCPPSEPNGVCWVQILDSKEWELFSDLQKYCLSHNLSPSPRPPRSNEIYGYYDQDILHRCCVLEEGDSVRVFHLDSGQVEVVDSVLLRLLPRCFGEFPMMAVPCCQTGSYFNGSSLLLSQILGASLTLPSVPSDQTQLPLPLVIEFSDNLLSSQDVPPSLIASPCCTPRVSSITPIMGLSSSSTVSPSSTPQATPTTRLSSPVNPSDSYREGEVESDNLWRLNSCTPNGLLPVYVSEVVSPALFWIQVTTSPDKDMKWMSDRIGEIIAPPKRQVCEGELYAYKSNSMNYRVRVECFTNYEETQVTAVCVDSGMKLCQVAVTSLFSLPSLLALRPTLAIPCKLHGVVSTREDGLWWTLDEQLLWKIIRNQIVYVKFPSDSVDSFYTLRSFRTGPVSLSVYLDSDEWDSVGELLTREGDFVDMDPAMKGFSDL